MRPLLLVMNAFGAFKGRQVLDFSLAWESGIFLITGPTGAGKTTVFDAITFALFGRASGADRRVEQFKSDYADATQQCFVEFTFLLRNEQYHIYRSPKQTVAKKRGDGERTIEQTAELTLPDGTILDKVSDVDRRIEELLGLGREQFKKIAMLAQGEFRKLLQANSAEKQEIFRVLFDTELYNQLSELLRKQESDLAQQVAKVREHIRWDVDSLMKAGVSELENILVPGDCRFGQLEEVIKPYIALCEKRKLDLQKEQQTLEKQKAGIRLEEAEALNRKIADYAGYRDRLAVLEKQKDEIDQQRQLVERLQKAKELSGHYDSLLAQRKHTEAGARDISLLEQKLPALRQRQQAAAEAQKKIPALHQERLTLAGKLAKMKALEAPFVRMQNAALELKQQKKKEQIPALLQKRLELLQQQKALGEQIDLVKAFSEAVHATPFLLQAYEKAKATYDQLHHQYVASQSFVLAKELKDGLPCPVCGSLVHPAPANDESHEHVSAAQLQGALESMNRTLGVYNQQDSASKSSLDALHKAGLLIDITPDKIYHNIDMLEVTIKNLECTRNDHGGAIEAAERQVWTLSTEAVDFADARFNDAGQLAKFGQIITGKIVKAETELNGAQQEIDTAQQDLGIIFPSIAAVQEEVSAGEKRQADLSRMVEEIEEAYKNSRSELENAETEKKAKQEELRKQNERQEELTAAFRKAIDDAGFADEAAFVIYAGRLQELNSLQTAIDRHQTETRETAAKCEVLKPEAEGKKPLDVAAMKEAWQRIEEQIQMLSDQFTRNEVSLKSCYERLASLQQSCAQRDKLEDEYGAMARVAKLVRGGNDKKLPFENFVLSAYFDDVLTMANLHLERMTEGRFQLKRSTKTAGNAYTGLDLETVDNNTGTSRPVDMLSGGESFETALALALGLAEVVQSYAGGVQIETMFVDEGFGSLDAQAIDNAISTLMSIQNSGRLVGLISHVAELQERIPVKLVVTKTNSGSSAEFVM